MLELFTFIFSFLLTKKESYYMIAVGYTNMMTSKQVSSPLLYEVYSNKVKGG